MKRHPILSPNKRNRSSVIKEPIQTPKKAKNIDFSQKITEILTNKGATNHCQSEFIEQVSDIVVHSDNPEFQLIQPRLQIQDSQEWKMALNFVIAYLKMYKMDITLNVIQNEYENISFNTGFKRPKEMDNFFEKLMTISNHLKTKTFKDQVHLFSQKVGLPDPS